jgi:hypothetical protein
MFVLPQARLRVIFVIALLLSLAFGMLSAAHGPGAGGAYIPKFQCTEDMPWLVGARVPAWHGDTGAVGSALPDGYLAAVSSDPVRREFKLWLYDGDDQYRTVPFGALRLEDGTAFPTGRPDFTGPPVIFYHGGQLKILIRSWNGGGNGPAPLMRVYTWCYLR